MNQTSRIALVCFCGAVIGTCIAARTPVNFNWLAVIIGMVSGGLVSYLGYDYKNVWAVAIRSWWAVFLKNKNPKEKRIKIIYVKSFGLAYLVQLFCLATFLLLRLIPAKTWLIFDFDLPKTFIMLLAVALFIESHLSANEYFFKKTKKIKITDVCDNYKKHKQKCFWSFLAINPISAIIFVFFLWPVLITLIFLVFLFVCFYYLFVFFKKIGLCLQEIFLGIHSDKRLLCMVDAAIGVFGGYHFIVVSDTLFSCLFGGVAGAILGVLNYELISRRWLKLVPKV